MPGWLSVEKKEIIALKAKHKEIDDEKSIRRLVTLLCYL